ncbi:hypothetical protein XA68_11774 [Ophiocordyceps unilateralis]|uniref:Uncharacterized protein n=1 Tax=Ophiocordyceps unilateralis TaxID=268505 RepID=A0A2A9PF54_OPHUN|nr:hypothetical protein XA68_11774 [Ophiocordyceps unilateralis]
MQSAVILSLFATLLAGPAMAAPAKANCPVGQTFDHSTGKCFLEFAQKSYVEFAQESSPSRAAASPAACKEGYMLAGGKCRQVY